MYPEGFYGRGEVFSPNVSEGRTLRPRFSSSRRSDSAHSQQNKCVPFPWGYSPCRYLFRSCIIRVSKWTITWITTIQVTSIGNSRWCGIVSPDRSAVAYTIATKTSRTVLFGAPGRNNIEQSRLHSASGKQKWVAWGECKRWRARPCLNTFYSLEQEANPYLLSGSCLRFNTTDVLVSPAP